MPNWLNSSWDWIKSKIPALSRKAWATVLFGAGLFTLGVVALFLIFAGGGKKPPPPPSGGGGSGRTVSARNDPNWSRPVAPRLPLLRVLSPKEATELKRVKMSYDQPVLKIPLYRDHKSLVIETPPDSNWSVKTPDGHEFELLYEDGFKQPSRPDGKRDGLSDHRAVFQILPKRDGFATISVAPDPLYQR